jgi:hypothetical protein
MIDYKDEARRYRSEAERQIVLILTGLSLVETLVMVRSMGCPGAYIEEGRVILHHPLLSPGETRDYTNTLLRVRGTEQGGTLAQ